MAEILRGAPVAAAMNENTSRRAGLLRERGIVPTLAIVRVGERPDDLSYERGAVKRCEGVGVDVRVCALPEKTDEKEYLSAVEGLNADGSIHGILLLRPLPPHIDGERARGLLSPEKDVDGCTDSALASVFAGTGEHFAPCTAQAVVEILDYYGVGISGRRACVLGRSLVVGRPAAMLLAARDATVSLCHSKTENAAAIARECDILVVCCGKTDSVGAEYLRGGQTVIDVGVGWSEEKQKLCGDVRFDEAEGIVGAVTPVPGGVGAVTTAVLAAHVVASAERSAGR